MKPELRAMILLAVGCAWGVRAASLDVPPGKLVDVGGRKLHLHCTGSGSPAVVLESGASSFAIDWTFVQDELSRSQRVCSYDRAGYGWSEARPGPETPAKVIADLHAALTAAGERPPFVMAGASMGAIYVRLYQLDYPGEVAGMALVDPAAEDRLFTKFQGETVTIGSLTADQYASTFPREGSIPVPRRKPQTGTPFDRLPADLYALRIKLDERLIDSVPSSITADYLLEFQEGQRAAFARLLDSRAKTRHPIGDIPLVVLTRTEGQTPGIEENHAGLAGLSTNSRHRVVEGAGHEVHLYQPRVVVEAIGDVLEAARLRCGLK